jgi:mono/diheme cytochrome c family protein
MLACLAFVLLAGCASGSEAPTGSLEARGREIAQANCASCHAVGRFGESPAPEAPQFRRLSENYRVATLEEALAEGISVGHPAMPHFQFSPDDVSALVTYLQSIQVQEAPQ